MDDIAIKVPEAVKAPYSRYSPRAVDRMLCQGMVPRELFKATREEYSQRGMDTGVFLTWALTQYLEAVNPERAQAVLADIKYAT